jgi:hypothetical protein
MLLLLAGCAPGGLPTPQPDVCTGGLATFNTAPAQEVYGQLTATYADERALADYGAVHRPATGDSATFDGTGRFVSYEWIRTVDVEFSYTCGGKSSDGAVTSWETANRGGVLDCDTPDTTATGDEAAMIRQVRELRCDEG